MMYLDVLGKKDKRVTHSGSAAAPDLTNVNIKINFTRSWETIVKVNDVTFMNIGLMSDTDD